MPNNGRGNPDVLTNDGRYAVQIKTRETLPTWLTEAVEQPNETLAIGCRWSC